MALDRVKVWHMLSIWVFLVLVFLSMSILKVVGVEEFSVGTMDFIILILASFRMTRLVVSDTVTDFARDYYDSSKSDFGKSMSQLLHCPWCVGIWMALLVAFLYYLHPMTWYFLFVVALAGAGTFIDTVSRLLMKQKMHLG